MGNLEETFINIGLNPENFTKNRLDNDNGRNSINLEVD